MRHHLFDSAGLKTMMNDDGGHYVHACTMLAPALLTATMQQHESTSSSTGASDSGGKRKLLCDSPLHPPRMASVC